MPFYEYECTDCKFYLETLQKISDPPLRQCPSCKKNALKKLVSAPVFRLKGEGWYETDFKSEKEEKRNLAERDESGAKETKAEAKPEAKDKEAAKPAEKPESRKATVAKGPAASKTKAAKKAVKPVSRAKPKAKPAVKAKKKARR